MFLIRAFRTVPTVRKNPNNKESRTLPNDLRAAARMLAAVMLLALCTERELRAYTDPGSGALAVQMLLAGFTGAVFYFRRALARVFKKRNPEN